MTTRVVPWLLPLALLALSACGESENRGETARARVEAGALLLDVRTTGEFAGGHVEGAINIPLPQLRDRYAELPRDRPIWLSCGVGQRGYYATRFLAQKGYRPFNLSGGYKTYLARERS